MPIKLNYTTGYAGTGKSTQLLAKLDTLPKDSTVVLGPTHKALERLRQEYSGPIELKTIHSLLGLIPRINEKAKHIGHLHCLHKLDKDIAEYSDIVIDEAGMINEEHFLDLVGKLEEMEDKNPSLDITFHLYLDPYQLLPVKGYQLQTDPATTTNLTTQYRSESPDIVATYTRFVEYLQGIGNDLSINYSENIKPFDIKQFKPGDRLLAYTNKAVGEWNTKIARQLGIKSYIGQAVQLGPSNFTVVDRFITPSIEELLAWFESGRLKLQNTQIKRQFLELSLQALLDTKGIEFIEAEQHCIPVIVGIGKAKKLLDSAGKAAILNRSKFKAVYALGRAFIMDYPFATTVHKAQGAEFDTVFIDKLDLQKSIQHNYYETYARMTYVAISRCKKTLYV